MRQPRSSVLIRSNHHHHQMPCPHLTNHHHLVAARSAASSTKRHSGRTTNNVIRASEYRNLRQVVPSLRRQRDLGKVEVVTEAAKYIDHLHKTLIKRFVSCGIPESLKDVLGTDNANELNSQHIMNLVTQMAAKQRAGQQRASQQQHQQQPSAISSQQQQQQPSHHQQHPLLLINNPPQLSSSRVTTNNVVQTQMQKQRKSLPASKRCFDDERLSCFNGHK